MGEPATPIRRRIELTVAEARLRFQQLVRVTGLTGQVTVVVDAGRPIAAIVPVSDLPGDGPPAGVPPAGAPAATRGEPRGDHPAGPARAGGHAGSREPARGGGQAGSREPVRGGDRAAAGWLERIERVREDVRRQHAGRIRELAAALDEAWAALDAARPAGTDRVVDTLRAAHADLRPRR